MTAFSALCGTMENSVTLRHGKNLMENVAEGDRFLILTFNGKAEWGKLTVTAVSRYWLMQQNEKNVPNFIWVKKKYNP